MVLLAASATARGQRAPISALFAATTKIRKTHVLVVIGVGGWNGEVCGGDLGWEKATFEFGLICYV